MEEHFTFPHNEPGLTWALRTTLTLRRSGFHTRTVERVFKGGFHVVTVVATAPLRPNRRERGCGLVGRA